MPPARPMLDDLELQHVQQIDVDEDQVLAQHGVPALEGDFLQRLDRRATRLTLSGVLTGPEVRDGLEKLREKFRAAQPVPFAADIATATSLDQVLIEELGVSELAGQPERFAYALTLREFIPAPAPQQEPPPPPPPPPPDPTVGTLIVEVEVEGQPDFDFSTVTVTVKGTKDDGASFERTLAQRDDNVWSDEDVPPGRYTVRASVTAPQAMAESASAAVRAGQTARVRLTLRPGVVIARAFVVHFRFNKAFVEPCMRAVLRQAEQFADDNSGLKLVIVGHTDKVDTNEYNQSLSERRARSVFAYMTFGRDRDGAVAEWTALRQKKPAGQKRSEKDSWGVREYQHMLQDLGFYPGRVDGNHRTLTDAAVRAFRCQHGLPPGTTVDDPTWEKLIEAYMAQDSIAIPTNRFLPNGDDILKWLGCGEETPLPLPQPTRGGAFRPYRRVELLFVDAAALPCQVPQPDTYELPEIDSVGGSWALGPGTAGEHCCFASRSCDDIAPPQWCIEPDDATTITVQGTIVREDGQALTRDQRRFVLITPDGEFKAGEQTSGEPQPALAAADGTFSFADTRVGVYSVELQDELLVRLEDETDEDVKGNAVCRRLSADDSKLRLVIVDAPVLREIQLPTVVHLMTALHPTTREVRTCPDALNSTQRIPQRTARTPDEVRTLFDAANQIWRQARVRFDVVDIVREAFAHFDRPECAVGSQEFGQILLDCAYPNAVNVFFFGMLEAAGEAGVHTVATLQDDAGNPVRTAEGCAMGDQVLLRLFANADPIATTPSSPEREVILSHELGHYLGLAQPDHVPATPTNAERLMLANVDATHRLLVKQEISSARAAPNAGQECTPLSLIVTGAQQIGGQLSHEFVTLENPISTVTVDASISDELLAVGTLTMTGGDPGANDQQRTVDPITKGVTEITATYTSTGGGQAISTRVVIQVLQFRLLVVGAEQAAPGSTIFIAPPDPNSFVTLVADLDPPPACVPDNLAVWTNGLERDDPLRRAVSRALPGSTTVRVKVEDLEIVRTIEIRDVRLVTNVPPFNIGVTLVQIEGVLNRQLNAPSKRLTLADLFAAQTAALFRARVDAAGVAGATVTATLISSTTSGTEVDRLTLVLQRTVGDIFVSDPILACAPGIPRAALNGLTFVGVQIIRASAGGKVRLQRSGVGVVPVGAAEATTPGRVAHIAAQSFASSGTNLATIRRQIAAANRAWAQAGVEIRERSAADGVAAPAGLLDLDTVSGRTPFPATLTDEERRLLGIVAGGPTRSAQVNDVNVYYIHSFIDPNPLNPTPPVGGIAYAVESFPGLIAEPGQTAIAIKGSGMTDTVLAHELGHHFLRGWGGNEHSTNAAPPAAWPASNVMHHQDSAGSVDLDLTQVQNVITGTAANAHPLIRLVP